MRHKLAWSFAPASGDRRFPERLCVPTQVREEQSCQIATSTQAVRPTTTPGCSPTTRQGGTASPVAHRSGRRDVRRRPHSTTILRPRAPRRSHARRADLLPRADCPSRPLVLPVPVLPRLRCCRRHLRLPGRQLRRRRRYVRRSLPARTDRHRPAHRRDRVRAGSRRRRPHHAAGTADGSSAASSSSFSLLCSRSSSSLRCGRGTRSTGSGPSSPRPTRPGRTSSWSGRTSARTCPQPNARSWAQATRPASGPTASCCCTCPQRVSRRSSRSPATPMSRSPGTAATRSMRRSRSAVRPCW